jgi:hypothetical protein
MVTPEAKCRTTWILATSAKDSNNNSVSDGTALSVSQKGRKSANSLTQERLSGVIFSALCPNRLDIRS